MPSLFDYDFLVGGGGRGRPYNHTKQSVVQDPAHRGLLAFVDKVKIIPGHLFYLSKMHPSKDSTLLTSREYKVNEQITCLSENKLAFLKIKIIFCGHKAILSITGSHYL